MLHIAICDDEKLHRERSAQLTRRELSEREPEIDCFESGEALLSAMGAGDYTPDIAILDIQMAGMDGITLAGKLNRLAPDCRIVFLTSYLDFATDVYETRHAYFVLKSQLEERIGPALQKALLALADEEPSIRFKSGSAARVVPVREILYLERRLHRTRVVKAGGEDWTTATPGALIAALPPGRFIRCHQSFWANRAAITALEKNAFTLSNGERLPISRTYQAQAKAAFFATLFHRQN